MARKKGTCSCPWNLYSRRQPSQELLTGTETALLVQDHTTVSHGTLCPHAAQIQAKQHQPLAPWPCASTLKSSMIDTWHSTTFCVPPLPVRSGAHFSSSLVWMGTGVCLIYGALGRNDVWCQSLGLSLRDWQLTLPASWKAHYGAYHQPCKQPNSLKLPCCEEAQASHRERLQKDPHLAQPSQPRLQTCE